MTRSAPSNEKAPESLVIIDEAHLGSFTEGDTTLEDELAELFVSTARGYLKRMKEALEEKRGWSAEAHALKGAGANLGAKRVAALAREAEFSPPSEDQIDALHEAIQEVEAFFTHREL